MLIGAFEVKVGREANPRWRRTAFQDEPDSNQTSKMS